MSLDGFIAGPAGEFDWIPHDPAIDFAALAAPYDTLLMGRGTYEVTRRQGGSPFPGLRTVVVSTTLRQDEHPAVTVIGGDAPAAVRRLKAEPGKDIWLFGGGRLFRSLLDAGLVDGVESAVVPCLLSGGIPFLPPGDGRASLQLTGTQHWPSGIVQLRYQVLPHSGG